MDWRAQKKIVYDIKERTIDTLSTGEIERKKKKTKRMDLDSICSHRVVIRLTHRPFLVTSNTYIDGNLVSPRGLVSVVDELMNRPYWVYFRALYAKRDVMRLALGNDALATLVSNRDDSFLSGYVQFENVDKAKAFLKEAKRLNDEEEKRQGPNEAYYVSLVDSFEQLELSKTKGKRPNLLKAKTNVKQFVERLFELKGNGHS